ncbi:MAG: AsmA family protein [Geminicoccaceae bacterium]
MALLLGVFVLEPATWKAWLAEQASAALDREVRIEGPIAFRAGWVPRFRLRGLEIANVEWGRAPNLAEIDQLQASIRLWPLLEGRVILPEVAVVGPRLFLQQTVQGEANWNLGQRPDEEEIFDPAEELAEEALPEDRTETPTIEVLTIREGSFEFIDEGRGIDLKGAIDTVSGGGGGGDQVELAGEGQFQGESFALRLAAGAFTKLRDPVAPYPVDLSLQLGQTEAWITGTLTRPLEVAGVDLNLNVSGDNLADIFPLTNIPFPPTPPYRLAGDLARDGEIWRFANVDGVLGDSDLQGFIEADLGREPLFFNIDLHSRKLDFDDLSGFVGAPVDEDAVEPSEGLIPDRDISLPRLRAANGQARLRAKQILAPGLPIDDLDAAFDLKDGVLRLEPVSFGIAKGTVNLWASLYGEQDPVEIDTLVRIRDLHLKEAFRGSQLVQEMGGQIDGRIKLSGVGNSLHEMLDSATGTSYLVMTEGQISALILELASLDIAETVGLFLGSDGDARVPIRCLATDLFVEQGVANVRFAVLDTRDSVVDVRGQIDLGAETLDLTVTPYPKDPSLFTFRSTIHVEDSFEAPSIAVDAGSILEFVPPFDFGTAENVPCERLIRIAKE